MTPAEHIAWLRKFWPSLYSSVPHEFTHHVEGVCDAYEALAAAARSAERLLASMAEAGEAWPTVADMEANKLRALLGEAS